MVDRAARGVFRMRASGRRGVSLLSRLRHNGVMKVFDYIRVVLVEPTHPGNIGAVARAMANMGARHLTLVRPHDFPCAEATARAVGARHIIDQAGVVERLDHAIADCALVIGASARARSIHWPSLTPAEAMKKVVETARRAPVALLFGRESRGLSNRELDRCHYLVSIPVEAAFPSLNLAAAVMVLLYELRGRASAAGQWSSESAESAERMAVAEEMRNFHQHLDRLLIQLRFGNPRSAEKLQRKLIRLFNRAQPYAQEIRMLRGIFSAIERAIEAKTRQALNDHGVP